MNSDIPIWLGSIPGWITSGSALTMLGLWFRYITQRRAQDGDRLTDLEAENRKLRTDFDAYRKSCIDETDELRREIAKQGRQIFDLEKAGKR